MYKIKEKGKDSFKNDVIEKTYEQKHSFTLADVEAHQDRLGKLAKELDAQIMLAGAKVQNIEINHKFVKKFSEQELFTIHMYVENLRIVDDATKKLQEVEKQQSAYRREVKKIYKELGYKEDAKKDEPREKGGVKRTRKIAEAAGS